LSVATVNIADGGTLLGPNTNNPSATVVVSRVDGEYARLTVGGLITLDDQTATVSAGGGAFTGRVDAGTIAFAAFEAGAGATFTYGTGSASAHRTALGLGATGSIAASDPLTVTQTWTDAAVTYTGLQVNVTDTASAAASLLMDLRVGGASRFRVDKTGTFTGTYQIHPTGPTLFSGQAGVWSFTYFGTPRFRVDSQRGFVCTPGNGFSWSGTSNNASSASDLLLLRDAANTLAQRNGNAAQESRIYGTYTDGSNYRRLALKMSTAGVAQIVAEGGGSGAAGNRIEIDGLRIGKGGGDVATNTALGASALNANTSGGSNSAVGREALLSNTTGSNNSAVGYWSLRDNTTGNFNSAVGREALRDNTTGGSNSAVGRVALRNNTTGGSNSAVGVFSLSSNTTGGSNSAVGVSAGRFIADGATANTVTNSSVYLGNNTKALANNQTNQIVIGHNAIGLGSNTAVLGNDSIVTTALKGNVGIGTTSPTERLSVGGNVNATAFIVGNNILTEAADFTLAESHAGQYTRLTKTGSTQTVTLPTTGVATGAEFVFYRATTEALAFSGGTVNGAANLASVPVNGAFALKYLGSGTYDFI
jgi:hypothetical protein